jgi:hypothetical protein
VIKVSNDDKNLTIFNSGCDIAQLVIHHLLNVEAWIQSLASLCGICSGQWQWDRFFSIYFGFPISNIAPLLHSHSPITHAVQSSQPTAMLNSLRKIYESDSD